MDYETRPASCGPTSSLDADQLNALVTELLHHFGSHIEFLLEDLGFVADTSKLRLAEVLTHWVKDINRLSEAQDGEVNPAKYISYLSFWLRKIKPVSNAFHIQDITHDQDGARCANYEKEVTDINERIAIYWAMHQLIVYAKAGCLDGIDPKTEESRDIISQRVTLLKGFFSRFMHFPADVGTYTGSNYHSLVYDMRYRTFGPHHLTGWLNQALFASEPTKRESR